MLSEYVYRAADCTPNRYLLARLVSRAVRGLHRPGSPLQRTVLYSLARIAASRVAGRAL
jgi:hypothetical protein